MADDRGPQLEITLIVLLLTCSITVSLRCYTMGFILKRFFLEDYLAVLGMVSLSSLLGLFKSKGWDRAIARLLARY